MAVLKQFILVPQTENQTVDFVTLDNGNYVDLLFVYKDDPQKGISNRLSERYKIK